MFWAEMASFSRFCPFIFNDFSYKLGAESLDIVIFSVLRSP